MSRRQTRGSGGAVHQVQQTAGIPSDVRDDDLGDNGVGEGGAYRGRKHTATLATIGERCIHLICELIDATEAERTRDIPVQLSRLSRTCCRLYIAIRNLPACRSNALVRISAQEGARFDDVAYWSVIGGIAWKLPRVSSGDTTLAERLAGTSEPALRQLILSVDDTACLRPTQVAIDVGGEAGEHERFDESWFRGIEARQRTELLRIFSLLYGLVVIQGMCTDLPTAAFRSLHVLQLGGRFFSRDTPESHGQDNGGGLGLLPSSLLRQLRLRFHPCLAVIPPLAAIQAIDLANCEFLTDISALHGVRRVAVRRCDRLEDVSPLAFAHTVVLDANRSLSDVSCLGRTHTLSLSRCHRITDLSSLTHVHTLDASALEHLTDVSALTHVHTLDLSHCHGITCFASLSRVHTLALRCCSGLTDVSALGSVHSLNLSYCKAFTDVSPLSHVHTLDLSHCIQLTNVSALTHVHTLRLVNCINITALGTLRDCVPVLNTSNCVSLIDASPV